MPESSGSSACLQVHEAREQTFIAAPPYARWPSEDGSDWAVFHRDGSTYRVRFPGLADFAISPDGEAVEVWPAPDVSEETVRHLFLNQAWPLALSRRQGLVLHGSAVAVEEGAVAFLGPSGRGKSTLAASFATNGTEFLTDDGLILDECEGRFIVNPSHPSIRLWDDSREALVPPSTAAAPPVDYTPKARLLAGRELAFRDSPLPLRCCMLVGDAPVGAVRIAPVGAREAFMGLVRNGFLLDGEDRPALMRHYRHLLTLVKKVPFAMLDYPRSYGTLAAVRTAIFDYVDDLPRA